MIDGLKPYQRTRDSGVASLREVPAEWEVVTLRRKLRSYDGIKIGPFGSQLRLEQLVESGFKVYGQGNVIARDFARGRKFIGQAKFDELSACAVRPGDLVVTMMGTSGRCAKVPGDAAPGIMDSHLIRLRPTPDIDRAFAARVIDEAPYVKEQIDIAGKGSIMHGLNSSMIKHLLLALPPVPEQTAIVRFLDHADQRIRRYIRAKRRLIKLLEEQKQAIVHRAVTRGLDPNARLKPSGVEWLGEVPEHWEVRPAKWFFREVDERSVSGDEELLSVSHLTGVTPRSEKNITMFMAESYVGHKLCRPGDVVINTMWAWMAALGVARQTGLVSPSYGVYRPRRGSRLSGAYAGLLLRTGPYVSEYVCRSTGIRSSRLRLYPEQFLRIPVVCPPEAEQRAILANVESDTADTASAAAAALREIELLREFRTRLIADVVTGKLDVREAAARLPEEVAQPEAMDEVEAEGDVDGASADDADDVLEEAEA